MQEGKDAALTGVGGWRYLRQTLGLSGTKDVEEGHRITDDQEGGPEGCRRSAGRDASQSLEQPIRELSPGSR